VHIVQNIGHSFSIVERAPERGYHAWSSVWPLDEDGAAELASLGATGSYQSRAGEAIDRFDDGMIVICRTR
jgi:hypothetical protein